MTDYIRRLVSGDKARFKDEELKLELDLVYVTDRIIIMGYPATGIEGLYRNRREDAKRFLESRHGTNFWVYNFCPVKENSYEKSVFGGRVSRYPFPDHHAPPLAIMPLVAREMHSWLSGAPDRVAVLHCKAGKGRSGTMACSYLVTLDNLPLPVSHHASKDPSETADLKVQGALDVIPPEENHSLTEHPTPSSSIKPSLEHELDPESVTLDGKVQPVDPHIPFSSTSPPPVYPPAQSRRAFTHTLKGVLDLHTAKRMKPPSSSKDGGPPKVKHGVSIPSQRRFLHYWALLLSHSAPAHFWAVDKGLSDPTSPNGGPASLVQSLEPHPKVKLTQIRLRMHETGGIKSTLVKAANMIIERTNLAKGPGVPLAEPEDQSRSQSAQSKKASKDSAQSDASTLSATPKPKAKSSSTNGSSQLWASLARYDDRLVDVLEKWEVHTRDVDGDMAKRRPGSESWSDSVKGEQALNDTFKDDTWDKKKMVRSFARLGTLSKVDDQVVQDKEKNEKIHVYTLRPLSDKRWEGLKHTLHTVESGPAGNSTGAADEAEKADIPRSEANSMYEVTSTVGGHTPTSPPPDLEQGVILDAGRELRVKLYMGQVFLGWLWFIPTFHMPQPPPPSASGSTSPPTSTSTTLHLTRKEIDFPLGLGKQIIDVEIDMEWVVPPASLGGPPVDVFGPPLHGVKSLDSASSDSSIDPKPSVTNAALNAVVGGGEEVGGGGIREAVEAKQGDAGA